MLTPNVILSAVEGSLQRQTRCLHYGRHDIYAFFSIWVNCYIITYFISSVIPNRREESLIVPVFSLHLQEMSHIRST